ncbi:MAG: hypothetical protein JWP78_2171 [Mucilaginibacter sp.]|nr:hypothetical protein [Mucilaginibacter sp.]
MLLLLIMEESHYGERNKPVRNKPVKEIIDVGGRFELP